MDEEPFLTRFRVAGQGAVGEPPRVGLIDDGNHSDRCGDRHASEQQDRDQGLVAEGHIGCGVLDQQSSATVHVPSHQPADGGLEAGVPGAEDAFHGDVAVVRRKVAGCGAYLQVSQREGSKLGVIAVAERCGSVALVHTSIMSRRDGRTAP